MNIFDMFFKKYSETRSQPEIPVQGLVAHDAAAVGNPVRVGGVYHSADPAVSDGDMVDLRVNAKGEVVTTLSGNKASEYEAITIDNTVGGKACTTAKVGTCTKAFISVETAQIRFTIDGTAPTTTAGHLLNPGDNLKLDSAEDIAAFRAIRTGAISGVIQCTYSV